MSTRSTIASKRRCYIRCHRECSGLAPAFLSIFEVSRGNAGDSMPNPFFSLTVHIRGRLLPLNLRQSDSGRVQSLRKSYMLRFGVKPNGRCLMYSGPPFMGMISGYCCGTPVSERPGRVIRQIKIGGRRILATGRVFQPRTVTIDPKLPGGPGLHTLVAICRHSGDPGVSRADTCWLPLSRKL